VACNQTLHSASTTRFKHEVFFLLKWVFPAAWLLAYITPRPRLLETQ